MNGKIQFIDKPVEQTTAATDAVLALMALAAVFYILQIGQQQPWKAQLWAWAFGLLALASILGTIAHGFQLADATRALIWHPLYLSLGLLVALFMVGAIYDVWGQAVARRALPLMLVVGAVFFGITLLWPDTFTVFIVYEGVAMLFALGSYIWLAWQGRLDGAWWMVAGILVTMVAAGAQANKAILFTLIWQFNYNGAYHLIQMAGIALLLVGLRTALLSDKAGAVLRGLI